MFSSVVVISAIIMTIITLNRYTPSGEGWKYGSSNNSREQGIHTLKTLRNRKTVVTNEPKSANSINDGQPEAAAEQKIPSGGRSSRPMSETVACKIFTLIYASSPPRVSDEILLAPKAKLDDGKIHLSYLEGSNCCSTLCGLLRLEDGTHEKDPRFKSIQVDQFRVETDSKTAAALYSLDGERLDTNGAVTVRIHPKVLNVFCIGN